MVKYCNRKMTMLCFDCFVHSLELSAGSTTNWLRVDQLHGCMWIWILPITILNEPTKTKGANNLKWGGNAPIYTPVEPSLFRLYYAYMVFQQFEVNTSVIHRFAVWLMTKTKTLYDTLERGIWGIYFHFFNYNFIRRQHRSVHSQFNVFNENL